MKRTVPYRLAFVGLEKKEKRFSGRFAPSPEWFFHSILHLSGNFQAADLQGHMKNFICFRLPDPTQQLLKVRHQGHTRTCETEKPVRDLQLPQQRALHPQGDKGFLTFSPNLKVSQREQSRANASLTFYQVDGDAGKRNLPLAVTDAQSACSKHNLKGKLTGRTP